MKTAQNLLRGVAAACFLMTASAAALAAEKSLYERLGGNPAITAVVEDFTANVGADARINSFFAAADMTRVKAKLVEQIANVSGGPEKYTGKGMKEVHGNMGITDAHFTALVEDLVKTLNKFKVPAKEQGELLAILGSLKGDIVTKK